MEEKKILVGKRNQLRGESVKEREQWQFTLSQFRATPYFHF
jgi:hypothetical protein